MTKSSSCQQALVYLGQVKTEISDFFPSMLCVIPVKSIAAYQCKYVLSIRYIDKKQYTSDLQTRAVSYLLSKLVLWPTALSGLLSLPGTPNTVLKN